MSEVGHLMLDRLRVALEGEIRQLDPTIPTVLLAHLMADAATYGAERFLAVGKGFTIPSSFLTRDAFDYVALGHVHRHQILCEDPLIIYPGSIERVDFSEEHEEKGFVRVNLERGAAEFEFCPLPVRAFRTIDVDLSEVEDPQTDLLDAIEPESIQDAVVRLIYRLRPEQLDHIDDTALHQALSGAHTYTMQAELVSQLSRPRLPELGVGTAIDPLDALKAYLANREDLRDLAEPILEAAKGLLSQEEPWLDAPLDPGPIETQLRLL
jgi:exonuclease SbcD